MSCVNYLLNFFSLDKNLIFVKTQLKFQAGLQQRIRNWATLQHKREGTPLDPKNP